MREEKGLMFNYNGGLLREKRIPFNFVDDSAFLIAKSIAILVEASPSHGDVNRRNFVSAIILCFFHLLFGKLTFEDPVGGR